MQQLFRPKHLVAVLALYVLYWTVYGSTFHAVIHHDMAEAWVWGREFESGYFKHPPLFAWIAGAWFQLFPREGWSFYLLSSLNAAVGLAGVFAIARRYLPPRAAWAGLLLVMLTPFFNLLALKFNANSVLLSLWPWTVYFFLRALEPKAEEPEVKRLAFAAAFGVLAGLSLLGKYFSVVLVASCVLASFAAPDARRLYRGAVPYVAVAAALLVITPHVLWVASHGFPTVEYAVDKTHSPRLAVLSRGFVAATQTGVFHGIAAAVFLIVFASVRRRAGLRLLTAARRKSYHPLAVLTLGPLVLTLVACLAVNVRISTQFMIPAFFLLPITVLLICGLMVSGDRLARLSRITAGIAAALFIGSILTREIAAHASFGAPPIPLDLYARDATRLWHEKTGQPLRIVAGDNQQAMVMAFYSPDSPSVFTDFDPRHAPWITSQRVEREGILVVCAGLESTCADRYPALSGERDWTRLPPHGVSKAGVPISVMMVMPKSPAHATHPDPGLARAPRV